MGSETEPAKTLLPYLQRADELQKHDPLVAYYCRLYAMERGMKIPNNERTTITNSLLRSLINQLEKDKKSLKLGPEDNLHLEGFALNVFSKADKQDRAGRADLSTAKTFYAASIFFEILNQFGTLQPDLEQKQKYAAWKAADIRKAIKEGRKPNPGPPGGDDDLSIPSSTTGGAYEVGPSETSLRPESGPSSMYHDDINGHHSTDIPQPYHLHDKSNDQYPTNTPHSAQLHNNFVDQHSTIFLPSPHYQDKVNDEHATNTPPPSYSPATYSAHETRPPPPPSRSESSVHSQQYGHQTYPQEPQHHLPQNYQSNDPASSYSYANFQSYPSFSESSLPSVPAHYPYYQGSDNSYSSHSAPPAPNPSYSSHSAPPSTNYSSVGQNSSNSRNGSVAEPAITPSQTYHYDCNYQPAPEKIAEAHKAARFAVGALAFDDVSIAVEHLKKSLELLTNPSAGH